MLDLLVGLFFLFVYEILSWPMRLALSPLPMSNDIRRILSRVAGPAILCFFLWVIGHFGVPMSGVTTWIGFALFFLGARMLCRIQKHEPDLRSLFNPFSVWKNQKREAIIEITSLCIFFSYLIFRRMAPEMTVITIEGGGSGSEKFDNAMLFWSSWHAIWLPPEDYWLSGHPQAYYYFGHFFWAWVGRAAFLPGEWIITLSLSRLVLLIWESVFLLIRAFGARAVSASIGAFFVVWGGNPLSVQLAYKAYDYVTGRMAEPAEKRDFPFASRYRKLWLERQNSFYSSYDTWKPSRALRDEDITEFLAWTAILGDFHAHHLSVPWTLAFIALVLAGDRWFKLRIAHLRGPPGRKSKSKKEKEKEKAKEQENESPKEPSSALKWLGIDRTLVIRFILWLACFIVLGVITTISNLWIAPVIGLFSLGILLWRLDWGFRGYVIRFSVIPLLAIAMLCGIRLSKGSLETPLPESPAAGAAAQSLLGKLAAKSPIKRLPPFAMMENALASAQVTQGSTEVLLTGLPVGDSGYMNFLRPGTSIGVKSAGGGPPERRYVIKSLSANSRLELSRPYEEASAAKVPFVLTQPMHSTIPMLLRHWGFHWAALVLAIAIGLMSRKSLNRWTLGLPAAGLLFLLTMPLADNHPLFIWLALICGVASLTFGKRVWLRPMTALCLAAACAILGALEIFYLNDAYSGNMERYNSYFKFSYPLWPLLGVGCWIGVQRMWYWRPPVLVQWAFRGLFIISALFVVAISVGKLSLLIWPLLGAACWFCRVWKQPLRWVFLASVPFVLTMALCGMPGRTIQAQYGQKEPRDPTLNAFTWLGNIRGYEAEAQMLKWIRKNIPPRTRIAEAVSDTRTSYTYSGRIASLAGRPIPMGWFHHEGQWRGYGDPALGENMGRLNRFWQARNPEDMRRAAQELGVRYAVFGRNELQVLGREKAEADAQRGIIPHTEVQAAGRKKAEAIYQMLRRAGEVRAMFPESAPEVFIFEIAQPGGK